VSGCITYESPLATFLRGIVLILFPSTKYSKHTKRGCDDGARPSRESGLTPAQNKKQWCVGAVLTHPAIAWIFEELEPRETRNTRKRGAGRGARVRVGAIRRSSFDARNDLNSRRVGTTKNSKHTKEGSGGAARFRVELVRRTSLLTLYALCRDSHAHSVAFLSSMQVVDEDSNRQELVPRRSHCRTCEQ
jgi:hypothetical protein